MREKRGDSMMMPKELSIEQADGGPRRMRSMACRPANANLDAAVERLVGKNGAEQSADGISKVVVERVFELRMTKNREQLGFPFDVRAPRLEFSGHRQFIDGHDGTLRIAGDDRFQDRLPIARMAMNEQADLALVCAETERDRPSQSGLMDRRQRLLHVPRAAFIIRRNGQQKLHGLSVAPLLGTSDSAVSEMIV